MRSLFFSEPGYTLGGRKKRVLTQAESYDPHFPADAQFVENVMWEESQVVFVTINLPGSNNDTLPWTGVFSNPTAQAQEVAQRTGADLRWLDRAFAQAEADDAQGVLIGLQADMWDPAQLAPGGDGLEQYTTIVRKIADLSVRSLLGGCCLSTAIPTNTRRINRWQTRTAPRARSTVPKPFPI